MRELKVENGYYHNAKMRLVSKCIFLPDGANEADFVLVSEQEGLRLLAEYDVEPTPLEEF